MIKHTNIHTIDVTDGEGFRQRISVKEDDTIDILFKDTWYVLTASEARELADALVRAADISDPPPEAIEPSYCFQPKVEKLLPTFNTPDGVLDPWQQVINTKNTLEDKANTKDVRYS